jgi:hypothetical protein
LKKAAYSWWPPEEFRGQMIGRFDLYPEDHSTVEKIKNIEQYVDK